MQIILKTRQNINKQIIPKIHPSIGNELNITLMRRVSPLEVSTTSCVSVAAWRYNPAKKWNQIDNQQGI